MKKTTFVGHFFPCLHHQWFKKIRKANCYYLQNIHFGDMIPAGVWNFADFPQRPNVKHTRGYDGNVKGGEVQVAQRPKAERDIQKYYRTTRGKNQHKTSVWQKEIETKKLRRRKPLSGFN